MGRHKAITGLPYKENMSEHNAITEHLIWAGIIQPQKEENMDIHDLRTEQLQIKNVGRCNVEKGKL